MDAEDGSTEPRPNCELLVQAETLSRENKTETGQGRGWGAGP